jgi:hypothetical protein
MVGAALAVGAFLVTGTAIADGKVTFDIKVSGSVDCYSPYKLDNVPLSLKGTGVLSTDRTAKMDWKLTAYYLLTAPSSIEGRLGDPAKAMGDGGTAQLKVVRGNGLALIMDYPDTRYTITVNVDGKKCGVDLVAKPKSKKNIYDIFAVDTQFLCSRFEVDKTSCRAR